MLVAPIPQERPRLGGNDRRFVRPVLGKLAATVDELVQERAVVRAQAREEHLVVRRDHHVYVIELHERQAPDGARHVADRGASRTRPVESLRRERDGAGLRERELHGQRAAR